jgi:hypothetical protein
MTHIGALVGAALAALMSGGSASARQWWVMEPTTPIELPAPADQLPKGCAVGHGLYASPAALYERMKGQGDHTARIEEEREGEVYVYYMTQHFKHAFALFFRTQEACEAAVQSARDRAADEARKLDKYR